MANPELPGRVSKRHRITKKRYLSTKGTELAGECFIIFSFYHPAPGRKNPEGVDTDLFQGYPEETPKVNMKNI
jgi:hypothetical protein